MRAGRITALLLVVGLTLLFAGPVQGARKATADERAQLAKLISAPANCVKAKVSTVTKKPLWGSVTFKATDSSCIQNASNGITVAKRKSGHWKFVTAGSDFVCTDLSQVPPAVVKDLKIPCR